jgi:cysteine synthase A
MLGVLTLAQELADNGRSGSIATLICDPGERYLDTCFSDAWVASQGLDLAPWLDLFARFERTGRFDARLESAAR